jgi:hypothetical protein
MPTPVPPTHEPGARRGLRGRIFGRRDAVADEPRFTRDEPVTHPHDDDDPRSAGDPFARDAQAHDPQRPGAATVAPLALGDAAHRGTHRRSRRRRGAAALGGAATTRRRRRGGWLLPLLALLLITGAAITAAVLAGDDGADRADRAPRDRAAQPAQPSAPAVRPGALGIDGRSVATGAALGGLVGSTVEARGMEVVQVDRNAGFFVGGGKGERTFVEWGPRAGGDEATQMPEVGDRVDLTGPVAEAPKQPGRTFGVPVASERVILKQGGYINADSVRPAR